MLDPWSILSTIGALAMRLFAWLVPSQVALDAAAMDVRLAILAGKAARGAGADAEERQRYERWRLALALRKHDIDVQAIKTERGEARRSFDKASRAPIEHKVSPWRFWARRSALKQLKNRALEITALNETQYDCGFRLQRSADTCVTLRRVLEVSPPHGPAANTETTEAGRQDTKPSMTHH